MTKEGALNEKDFKNNQKIARKILEDDICLSELLKMPKIKDYIQAYEKEHGELN